MFTSGIALIIYALYILFVVSGVAVIVLGVIAKRRGRAGNFRLIVGIVLILIPLLVIASSYLPGQQ